MLLNLVILYDALTHQTLLRRTIIGVVWLLFVVVSLPAQQPSTSAKNLDICDTLLHQSSRRIVKQLRTPLFPQDTLYLTPFQHEGAWMLEIALFSELKKLKRFRPQDSLSAHRTKLSLRITELATRYFAVQNEFDMVVREISCAIAGTVETSDGAVQALETVQEQYRDTIPRQSVSMLESKQYAFTASSLPEAKPNFWKQIAEPAIVILSGALIVALFFLVRTQ